MSESDDRIRTPDEFHVMDVIQSRYKIALYGRTIYGTHLLTQYSPIFINIEWPETAKQTECFRISVAKNERTKPVFAGGFMSLDDVMTVVGRYCKAKSVSEQQLRLF